MGVRTFAGSALALALLLPLSGCSEGEGEKLGRQLDDAMDRVERDAEDLGDELEDRADEIEKKAKELEKKYD